MFPQGFHRKLKRGPAVALPKDLGSVLARAGLQHGDVVLDAGAGSGWAAIAWGLAVAPNGRVHSFERRPEFADLAEGNVRRAGLEGVVKIVRGSAFKGFKGEADFVFLDCGDSNKLVKRAATRMKQGGLLVGYTPHSEQMRAFVNAGLKAGLVLEECVENMERQWLVREQGCRPVNIGLIHTAFLIFMRKPAVAVPAASKAAQPTA